MKNNGSIRIRICGQEFKSITLACAAFGFYPARYIEWQNTHPANNQLEHSENFLMLLRSKFLSRLILFSLGSFRLKSTKNKEKYVVDKVQHLDTEFKDFREFLDSFKHVKVSLFEFESLLKAAEAARVDLLELTYLRLEFPEASAEQLLTTVQYDCTPDVIKTVQ